jgi:peptidoglycan/LPS O-acetylase OafA/YrhL
MSCRRFLLAGAQSTADPFVPMERIAANNGRAGRPSLPILTALRFFAAADVVIFHFTMSPGSWTISNNFLKGLTSGGHAAVTFFFILSGFILTYAHAGQTERDGSNVRATSFWRLRFARIAPAYFLGLLIALPLLAHELRANSSLIVGPILVMFFLQAWWPASATLWNYPAWSLSVEGLFYALFPWLARASARLSRTSLFLAAYALIVASTAYRADFFQSDFIPDDRLDLRFQAFFPILHLPQFVFGMALGRAFLFGPTISPRLHTAMLCVGGGVLVLLFGYSGMLPWWTRSDAALAFIYALVIFGGAGASSAGTLLALPVCVLLGEASYSIYILHIPLRLWWETFADGALGLSLPPWLNFLCYFGVVTVASVISFRHVETPLRRLIAGRRASDAAQDIKLAALSLKA